MEMTIDNCIEMLIAKETCIERETSGIDTDCNSCNCDNCSLCYEQGTMGEQKETLKFAVDTMYKYQKIVEIVEHYKENVRDKVENENMEKILEVIEDGRKTI